MIRGWTIIAKVYLVTLLLACCFYFPYSVTNKPRQIVSAQPTKSESKKTDSAITAPTKQQAADRTNQKEAWYEEPNWLIAIITAILAIIAAMQWFITRRQVSHFERKERAWLHPENLRVIALSGPNGQIIEYTFSMIWKNAGNTPALACKVKGTGAARSDELTESFDFGRSYVGQDKPSTAAPSGILESAGATFTIAEINAALLGQSHLYLWGQVVYEDIFKGTETRISQYCWKLAGGVGHPNQAGAQFYWGHEPLNNKVA